MNSHVNGNSVCTVSFSFKTSTFISFIFIPCIHTGLQNPSGYGNSHVLEKTKSKTITKCTSITKLSTIINNRQIRQTDSHWYTRYKSHLYMANHTRLCCKHPSAWDAEHLTCKQSCQFQMHQAMQRLTRILSVQDNICLVHAVSSYMPSSQTSSRISMICACSSFPLHKSQSRGPI